MQNALSPNDPPLRPPAGRSLGNLKSPPEMAGFFLFNPGGLVGCPGSRHTENEVRNVVGTSFSVSRDLAAQPCFPLAVAAITLFAL